LSDIFYFVRVIQRDMFLRERLVNNSCLTTYEHMTQYNGQSDIRFWVSVMRLAALVGSTLASRPSNDDVVKLILAFFGSAEH